eukprot:TRINITY_DN4571_c0_g1_i5.p1 TRINITY_DN4571_c0_g1~~TRINITY_DN4571_c0_g1_i5.p1  ORF type:complete len:157 (-),score=41.89 TRINITY_DN4571_c0_g1_i5:242-712(-)
MSSGRKFKVLGVKAISLCGFAYLSYEIVSAMFMERRVKKYEYMKKNVNLDQEKIDEEYKDVKQYLDNHYGQKIVERISSIRFLEEQLQIQIKEKNQLRERLVQTTGSEEELKKLEEDLRKLNEVFTKISPRKDTNLPNQGLTNMPDVPAQGKSPYI